MCPMYRVIATTYMEATLHLYVDTANGKIEQNEAFGVQVGGTYKFNEKLRSTLAYGALFADDGTDYARLNDSCK